MKHGICVCVAAIVALCTILVTPQAIAADEPVDLELVIAVDVSWSMDPDEQALQRDGYVQAFRDPEVQRAILSGAHRKIAVSYVEWAGPQSQIITLPWTVIRSAADAMQLADTLAAKPITRHRMTSISAALEFAGQLFTVDAISGTRRVIDISGDGPNNSGPMVAPIRDRLVADGIVINGLPVVLKPGYSTSMFDIPNLEDYYQSCVVGGPGSFMIPIKERNEFATATRQKLLLEIAGYEPLPRIVRVQMGGPSGPSGAPQPVPGHAQSADCTVGEQLWRRYMDR
jgi:Protein of unknown function (DUF1194)